MDGDQSSNVVVDSGSARLSVSTTDKHSKHSGPEADSKSKICKVQPLLKVALEALKGGNLESLRQAWKELFEAVVPLPPEDKNNAAVLLRKAMELILEPDEAEEDALLGLDEYLESGMPLSGQQRQLLEGYVEKNRQIFPIVQEALRRPQCVFPVDYEAGCMAELGHVVPFWHLVKLYTADLLTTLERDRLAQKLGEWLELSKVFASGFSVYEMLLAFNSQEKLVAVVGRLATENKLDASDVESVFATYRFPAESHWPERSLMGGFVVALTSFVNRDPNSSELLSLLSPHARLSWEGYRVYLEVLGEAALLVQGQPYDKVREPLQRLLLNGARSGVEEGVQYLLSSTWKAYERLTYFQASTELLRTAASAFRYKVQKGAYPASLSELGTTARDPFTGRNFFYRREGTGFILYSAGPEGIDHGGDGADPSLSFRWIK